MQKDVDAFFRETQRDTAAYAFGGSGNQRCFSLKFHAIILY
jgi:hypothetical protein